MTSRPTRARFLALAAVAALVLLLPAAVAAHAELLETTPADGATVTGTPEELVAVFDDELVVDESSLSIRNAQGDRLAVGHVDPDEPTHLLISPVPELAIGTYEMRWTAGTADGHVERGTWSFTVAGAIKTPETPAPAETAAPSSAATATPAASASATPDPSTAPTPSGTAAPTDPTGTATNDAILPIIAALAIVLIGAAALLSRRGRPSSGG
jgi:methionine-rich copper-binding protein CopC